MAWNLPPGCTNRMIDEAAGAFDICECCAHPVDDCICPECVICEEVGNPVCYQVHGLTYSMEQLKSLADMALREFNNRLAEDALFAEMEKDQMRFADEEETTTTTNFERDVTVRFSH